MSELRTDFKDDVLDVTQNEKRKYRIIHNDDGTISLEDATVYLQKGDSFGANDLNEMNRMANQMDKAAGEILTMADDIDTLQEDVEFLKGNDSTMVWDIQDTAIIDKELLYTLPITLNGIKVINLNNEIHVIGYTTSDSKNHHYKRNGETWEEIDIYTQTGGYVRFYENRSSSDICVYKNKIYATCYGFSNTTDAIYIYNPSTNKWTSKYTNSSSSGSMRRLYLVIAGGQLYCVHQLSATYLYVSSVADDGTLTRLYSSSSGDVSNVYGAWEQDNLIYISCAKDTSNLIKVFKPSTKTITRNINIKDSLGNYRYIREGDIIHFKNSTYDRFYLKNNSVYSQAKLFDVVANEIIYTIIENDNYLATPTDIYTYKLYNKLMTSYAPKGTKIYLSHETHKGVSSNLKAIEGGYLVTETGKVEIGVYDY